MGLRLGSSFDKWQGLCPVPQLGHIVLQMDSPTDLENFRGQLQDHFCQYPICRSEIVQIRRNFFFRQIEDPQALLNSFKIHDEPLCQTGVEQLTGKLAMEDFEPGEPFLKLILVKSTEPGKTFVMLKFHHVLFDGLSQLVIFSKFQDKSKENEVPIVVRSIPSTFSTILNAPRLHAWLKPQLDKVDAVSIPTCQQSKGIGRQYTYTISDHLDSAKLRQKAKALGVSVNHLVLGAIGLAYRKVSEPGEAPPKISVDIPISIWSEDDLKAFQPNNRWLGRIIAIDTSESLSEAAKMAKHASAEAQIQDEGVLAFTQLRVKLDSMVPFDVVGTPQAACSFSNQLGSLHPWTFGGKQVEWVSTCANGQDEDLAISLCTIGSGSRISLICDKGAFDKPKEFLAAMVEAIKTEEEI